jgi:large subunit ribosomal protein L30
MSTPQKHKAKPKAPRKAKVHVPRKRAAPSKKPAAKEAVQPQKKAVEVAPEKVFLFAVRLKGSFGMPFQTEETLTTLRLNRKFNAVLLENNANVQATLRQAKDYVTWGEAKPRDIVMLLKERGELLGGLRITDKSVQEKFGVQTIDGLVTALADGGITLKQLWQKGLKPVFRLHPPSGGFATSTKRPHGSRGEFGYRGPEMATLVARMV